MLQQDGFHVEDGRKVFKTTRYIKCIVPMLVVGIVLASIILALSVLALAKIDKKVDEIQIHKQRSTTDLERSSQSSNSFLSLSIRIDEVMSHLNELQRIAAASNGTRAVSTLGFNRTLNYITNYLKANTNFKVTHSFFNIKDFQLARDPVLISSMNDVIKNYRYSRNLSDADFYHVKFSTSLNLSTFTQITVIPNVACSDTDWNTTSPPPAGRIVLVKRGICAFQDKVQLAEKYNAKAVLLYNDGQTPERISPVETSVSQENTLPVLFLSFTAGQALATAARAAPTNVSVRLVLDVKDLPPLPVGNICADTPTGDSTQTIIIGSHSDSVPDGPGINDNGSGSAANLALAVALARLFRTPFYHKYKYRVRFCWWGAEEIGLLGSDHHVKQAKNSSTIGERLSDYLVNLNYDMLASPNYIFGIYDGRTAKNDTPAQALPGSNKITSLFREWFVEQHLPWDYTDFSGRSDYGPFLAEGIVAGGLFSGAEDVKSVEQRNRYDAVLGQGLGGIPDIKEDPCYHKACDSIENINVFGYEKMVQAAAYALEYLGRKEDLRSWLYPGKRAP
ncbi:unnamed protein product [Adineta ricciae]|uniref:Peptide hydrolase n=1 Tax=Adineta ricciae TaxID=249248 RepID=A0A814PKX8_ADIRI|nr:unnamed protein product [Adineta ricciae]